MMMMMLLSMSVRLSRTWKILLLLLNYDCNKSYIMNKISTNCNKYVRENERNGH
jgi:hypothetical protein